MNEDNRTIALMAASIYGGLLAIPPKRDNNPTAESAMKTSIAIASEIYNRCNKDFPIYVRYGDGTDNGCTYSER
ncbi:hypothetical protein UFOVP354_49 [uncultured Caudovirales phage]|uniref:Uncharacterized protein n=1 Tax=uncultured Caudovirales phage TaxID=2100421 RepID=A0A6J5M7R5_9CAUD|nr:hypothetical protein UFOVP354_49 [uncultured Caudovirales phage]